MPPHLTIICTTTPHQQSLAPTLLPPIYRSPRRQVSVPTQKNRQFRRQSPQTRRCPGYTESRWLVCSLPATTGLIFHGCTSSLISRRLTDAERCCGPAESIDVEWLVHQSARHNGTNPGLFNPPSVSNANWQLWETTHTHTHTRTRKT